MPIRTVIYPGEYHDSIELMRIALELECMPGVRRASLMMGTQPNQEMLRAAGLLADPIIDALPTDLVLAIETEGEQEVESIIAVARDLLLGSDPDQTERAQHRPRTVADGLQHEPA